MNFFSNIFTNNIYLVLKLLGYYGTHWRAGNRPPFSSGTGFVAGRTFVCLFVCLFVVCQEGGVTHITWQSVFFNNAGGFARNKYLILGQPTRSPCSNPVRLPNPGYTGSGGAPNHGELAFSDLYSCCFWIQFLAPLHNTIYTCGCLKGETDNN